MIVFFVAVSLALSYTFRADEMLAGPWNVSLRSQPYLREANESSRCMLVSLVMPNTYILTLLSSLNVRRGWKFSHEPDGTAGPTAGNKLQMRSTFTPKVIIVLLILPGDF